MWTLGSSRLKAAATSAGLGAGYLFFNQSRPESSREARLDTMERPSLSSTLKMETPRPPASIAPEMKHKDTAGERRFSLKEIKDLCETGRVVVGFKGGVYDVTDFTGHPGGSDL